MAQTNIESSYARGLPIKDLKSELERLKDKKGRLSRKVAEARSSGQSTDELITELKAVSSEIKALSKDLKSQLNANSREKGEAFQEQWDPFANQVWPDPNAKVVSVVALERGDSASAEAWDAFVQSHPLASPYHRISVRNAIERAFGHKTQYLYALDKSHRFIGVLPLVNLKSRLFGNFVVSMPYFNYGGILANNEETASRLVEAAGDWADSFSADHMELRHLKASGMEIPKREEKVTFWLPLPKDPDQLWGGFKPKVRAQIRRPEQLSPKPQVRIGGQELLDDFYRVFARNMRDLGTPVYAKRFFHEILRSQGTDARLVVIYLEEKPVGCAFLIGFRNRMEIPWASTLRETNPLGINMMMYWEILRFTIAAGYEIFDFGRCSRDSGTYRFKQQWGAMPLPLVWEYRLPSGKQLPALNPDNPKFRLMIAVWRCLPVWMTRFLGPGIVKSLP